MSPGSPQLDTDKWWKWGGEVGGKAGGKVNLLSFYGGGKVGGKEGGKVLAEKRRREGRERRGKGNSTRASLLVYHHSIFFFSLWLAQPLADPKM